MPLYHIGAAGGSLLSVHPGRMKEESNTFHSIYLAVKSIPRGRVASYSTIAILAGNPKWTRVVGNALHRNPAPDKIPCHRIVSKTGRLSPAFAFGGADEQARRLQSEGVEVKGGRVDMKIYGWEPHLLPPSER